MIKTAKDWIKGGGKAVAPWDEKGFKLPGGPVFSKAGMKLCGLLDRLGCSCGDIKMAAARDSVPAR